MSALILAIDAYEPILDLYEFLLTYKGHRVVVSQDVMNEDATSVERTNPDLIILDFMIGRQASGLRMFEALKRHEPTACIPIVVCTTALPATLLAFGDHLNDPRCRFILKPFNIDELMIAITQLLELKDTTTGPHGA
jgi:CheY-like chemotaxis protein